MLNRKCERVWGKMRKNFNILSPYFVKIVENSLNKIFFDNFAKPGNYFESNFETIFYRITSESTIVSPKTFVCIDNPPKVFHSQKYKIEARTLLQVFLKKWCSNPNKNLFSDVFLFAAIPLQNPRTQKIVVAKITSSPGKLFESPF